MKKFVAFLLFAFCTASLFAQKTNSISGKWKIHGSVAGNESNSVCTFIQTDNILSGSCVLEQPEGTTNLVGKVEGNKISWTVKADYNGNPLTITYSGLLEEGKISGDINVEEFGITGEFSASPVK